MPKLGKAIPFHLALESCYGGWITCRADRRKSDRSSFWADGVRRTALACRDDVRNSRDGFADSCRTGLLVKQLRDERIKVITMVARGESPVRGR